MSHFVILIFSGTSISYSFHSGKTREAFFQLWLMFPFRDSVRILVIFLLRNVPRGKAWLQTKREMYSSYKSFLVYDAS